MWGGLHLPPGKGGRRRIKSPGRQGLATVILSCGLLKKVIIIFPALLSYH